MLDVRKSPTLQAAVLGVHQANREIRTNINKNTRKQARPLWSQALASRAAGTRQNRVLVAGAKVTVSARGIGVRAATSSRPLSGGLVPSTEWHGDEFGMQNQKRSHTQKSRKGTSYTLTRMTGRQFKGRKKHGYVAFDAASEVGTRLVGIWVKTIVDEFRTFADIKGSR